MKHLAILGLLVPLAMVGVLAGQDVTKGTPKQGIIKQEPSKKGQEQPHAQNHNQSAIDPPPPTAAPQPAAPTHDEAAETSRQNLQIQRWLMYFTGSLAVVGFLQLVLIGWQAVLLRKTREDVHRQADWMETQAGHMNSQVEEMKLQRKETVEEMRRQAYQMGEQAASAYRSARAASESAQAALAQIKMMKDKERARISVSISDNDVEVSPAYSFDAITIKIANDGTTSAFNVRAKGEVFGHLSEDLPPMRPFIPLTAPSVIRANNPPTYVEVILVQSEDMSGVEDSPIPYFFHIGGIVEYEDVFGESHTTTFRHRLKVNGILPIPDSKSVRIRSWGGWKSCGSPEENRAT